MFKSNAKMNTMDQTFIIIVFIRIVISLIYIYYHNCFKNQSHKHTYTTSGSYFNENFCFVVQI